MRVFSLLFIVALCGCPKPGPKTPAKEAVTFSLEVNAQIFSPDAEIIVQLWDQEQLAIAQRGASCTVSIDASGKEQTTCPDGVTFEKASPQEERFAASALGAPLKIVARTISVGDEYQLSVGGKAADNCNAAAANVSGKAEAKEISLKDFNFAVTEKACLPQP